VSAVEAGHLLEHAMVTVPYGPLRRQVGSLAHDSSRTERALREFYATGTGLSANSKTRAPSPSQRDSYPAR
jgi:hypothetical protein